MKFNIATVCRPIDFDKFLVIVRDSAKKGRLTVLGYVVVPGPGCYNHGIMLDGPENEQDKFVSALCMVLQPGKYSRAPYDDSAVVEGKFEVALPS